MSSNYLSLNCPDCGAYETMYIDPYNFPEKFQSLANPYAEERCDDCAKD